MTNKHISPIEYQYHVDNRSLSWPRHIAIGILLGIGTAAIVFTVLWASV